MPGIVFVSIASFVIYFVLGFSSHIDHKLAAVGLSFIPLAMIVTWFVRLGPIAVSYLVLHSYIPGDIDDSTWPFWRKLDAALPPLDSKVLGFGLLSVFVLKIYTVIVGRVWSRISG
jgi:hypothetical protein